MRPESSAPGVFYVGKSGRRMKPCCGDEFPEQNDRSGQTRKLGKRGDGEIVSDFRTSAQFLTAVAASRG